MITLLVYEPLWKADRNKNGQDYTHRAEGYTHTIQALGGYWSASFTTKGTIEDLEDWRRNGLGRHIVTRGDLGVCWEGFANQVTITMGNRSVTRGPLLDVMNRIQVVYNIIDRTTVPPSSGLRIMTAVANDTLSQSRYGILYGTFTQNDVTLAEAEDTRDSILEVMKYPKQTESSDGGELAVRVDCLGYFHYMSWPYNYTTTGAAVDLSNDAGTGKLQLAIAADPNSIFSQDWTQTVDNTFQVSGYENSDRKAKDIIQELVRLGDTSGARYLFGVYENLRSYYEAAPTTVEYHRLLSDPAGRITTPEGTWVQPWDVKPGKWLKYPDYVGTEETDRAEDPRMTFLESVTFTAPDKIDYQGNPVTRLPQKLAQKGLGGM